MMSCFIRNSTRFEMILSIYTFRHDFIQKNNAISSFDRSFKQRNDELFEENRRLLQEQQRQQQNLAWRTTVQQAFADPHAPQQHQQQQQQQQQPSLQNDIIVSSSPSKVPHSDSRRDRSKGEIFEDV